MTERPILFQGAMVRALLAGTKTQTRRIVKPQPDTRPGMECTRLVFKDRKGAPLLDEALEATEPVLYRSLCPYGQPGDRLWVREAWRAMAEHNTSRPLDIPWRAPIVYEASRHPDTAFGKLRPGMFMPRWASRITLEITGVRVERLQDISEADAKAEGATPIPDACDHVRLACADIGCTGPQPYRAGFRALWQTINGAGSWDANPWVWVVEFKRVQP